MLLVGDEDENEWQTWRRAKRARLVPVIGGSSCQCLSLSRRQQHSILLRLLLLWIYHSSLHINLASMETTEGHEEQHQHDQQQEQQEQQQEDETNLLLPIDPPLRIETALEWHRRRRKRAFSLSGMPILNALDDDSASRIDIQGGPGKTWLLRTLAAHGAVAGVRVVYMSSLQPNPLVSVVRALLLREGEWTPETYRERLRECLSNIHTPDLQEPYQLLALLECLDEKDDPPTLLLWDDYEHVGDDVDRKLRKLSHELSWTVVTASTKRPSDFDKWCPHKIRLVREEEGGSMVALVGSHRIPFSISSAGILC